MWRVTLPVVVLLLAGQPLLAPALILAGVVATAGGSYLVARRTSSGDIRQTPAEALWAASEHIRTDLTAEVRARRESERELRQEVDALKVELAKANRRIAELERGRG